MPTDCRYGFCGVRLNFWVVYEIFLRRGVRYYLIELIERVAIRLTGVKMLNPFQVCENYYAAQKRALTRPPRTHQRRYPRLILQIRFCGRYLA